MHDIERHQRAKALFLELLALPADVRASVLEHEAGDDAELRAEVESLLRHAGPAETAGPSAAVAVNEAQPARFTAGHLFAGRYRIIAELGRGATGEVYRALDTRLNVEIALKIVRARSAAAIRRLHDEVRLARQITDPAVCRVYDVDEADGENFLTMELVDGETLASLLVRVGRLSASKVRQIAIEILSGLAAAHAQGILHRDLKPSNVMVDASGSVRVTDFGVASYEERAQTAPFAGTPAFMAPEQLDVGAPASAQTDLYAVGLILYEALVGHLPSHEQNGTTSGHRAVLPPKPSSFVTDVDPVLERVVMQLLAPDPEDRPRSAADAAKALGAPDRSAAVKRGVPAQTFSRAWAALALISLALLLGYFGMARLTSSQSRRPIWEQVTEAAGRTEDANNVGIAVLPLADETETRDQSSLAAEIQREIIQRLEGVHELRVIGENSSDRYGANANIRKAGRELGVNFLASGRVKGRADDPEIELTLYDVRTGKPLWRETYESERNAPLPPEVERRFVRHVSDTLDIAAADSPPPTNAPDIDSSTYTLYLRGREHVPPYTEAEFGASVALLREAIERSPQWAEPYAAVATAYVVACAIGWVEPAEGYPVARRYAERALALDATLCEAHVAIAIVAGEYDWDWDAAATAYRNASALCPGSAWVQRSRARFLSTQGRFQEALQATSKALELDPTSALMIQGAAQRFYEARQYDRAVTLSRIAKRLDPLYPYAYTTLGYALIEQGHYAEAVQEFDKSIGIRGRNAADQARQAYALARSGDQRSATIAAQEARTLGTLDPTAQALLCLAEQDEAGAVAALADAVTKRAPPSVWLAVSPLFDRLHGRDDFRALVTKVGLQFPNP